jgi:hypothetical protein
LALLENELKLAESCASPFEKTYSRDQLSDQEDGMRETRRVFVMTIAGVAGVLAAAEGWLLAQNPPTPPPPPKPAETPNPAEIHSNPQATAAARRARLQENEKEFREGVERLFQLASELREEVQKTATTDVLSIRMVKKTEEIEKLAKVLKAKAKGG